MDELLNPDEFKIDSFFSGGTIHQSLITNNGEKNINDLIQYLIKPIKYFDERKKKNIQVNKALTINQLRKFYDSFLNIYNIKANENEKKIQLLMLKANADYSAKRLVTNRFKIVLANRIDLIVKESGEDFKKNLNAFKLHFEALVAYYPKESKEE